MKPYQRYTSLAAAAALALAGSLQAQNGNAGSAGGTLSGSDPDRTPSSSMGSSSMGGISRVSKEEVRQQFTAKDLIGAEVYDRAGEKIGDITDLSFAGAFPSGLANSYNLSRMGSDATDATRTATTPTRPGSASPGSPAGASTESGTSTSPTTRSPGGSLDSRSPMMTASSMSTQPQVFISVGGLWGIGDDVVSVPASDLSFNSAEDRFELSANKADVVALAEQDERPGYAAGSLSPLGSSAAGKQKFGDEAVKVQNALENDPTTSGYAYKVFVTVDGDDVELRGTVNSEEQHQQILQTARRATSSQIEDKIEVQE